MEPNKLPPPLDFTRGEAIQDMKNRLSAPSDSGKTMRNQMRDGTLTQVELSNGRVQPISRDRFPELYQWFHDQEVAMGIIKPSPDAKVATMTPKEWGGVAEMREELDTASPSKPAKK